jgi:hypothetical protein
MALDLLQEPDYGLEWLGREGVDMPDQEQHQLHCCERTSPMTVTNM